MSTVPRLRPYATRDEWRRDFHDGMANMFDRDDAPTPDVWDVLDRETGQVIAHVARSSAPWVHSTEVAYNRRTGEVVYGEGV